MPSNQEKVAQLLADSHFAFINSQNSEDSAFGERSNKTCSKESRRLSVCRKRIYVSGAVRKGG